MKHNFRQRVINEYGLPVVKVESVNCELGSGIFDKNGVEIFEGDIVQFRRTRDHISFKNGVMCYGHGGNLSYYSTDELEVVGHIAQD